MLLLFLLIFGGIIVNLSHANDQIGFIDLCDPLGAKSCGSNGECQQLVTGTRCKCPDGWMGPGCIRPCQDVHRSCQRWNAQGRCQWHKSIISPFFLDNCARTCAFCRSVSNQKRLSMPLPPILEPMAWLIGRWQTQTIGDRADRFPVPLLGPYTEILDVQIADAPAFDRPSLNVSVQAWTISSSALKDEHQELGFLTVKPAREQTGFVDQRMDTKNDLIALELASNTGFLIIEEGHLAGQKHLQLATTWFRQYFPVVNSGQENGQKNEEKKGKFRLDLARRAFVLVEPNMLEERLDYYPFEMEDSDDEIIQENKKKESAKKIQKSA